MRTTEHDTKRPVPTTGFFAMLRGFIHARGTGASKITTPVNPRTDAAVWTANAKNTKATAVLSVAFLFFALTGFATLGSTPALAEFSRPFIGQLPTGTPETGTPYGAIAIGGGIGSYSGNVWVGASTATAPGVESKGAIDEFGPTNLFIRQILGEEPPVTGLPEGRIQRGSLAFDDLTEQLYTAQGGSSYEFVAVDNSSSPAAGDLYFTGGAFRQPTTVRRQTPGGQPAPFKAADCPGAEYISNGDELIGRPSEDGGPVELWEFNNNGAVRGIAVDSGSKSTVGGSAGDIYVIAQGTSTSDGPVPQVDEYSPEGCFIGAIKGEREVEEDGQLIPLFPQSAPIAIAVDPTDGDVVVTTSKNRAVEEFTASGEYLGEIGGTSRSAPFERGFNGLAGEGIAVSPIGDLYVIVCEKFLEAGTHSYCEKSVVDVFGPSGFYPGAVTAGVSAVGPGGATLSGVVRGAANTEGKDLELSECYFEVVSEAAFQKNVSEGKDGLSGFVVGPEDECVPGLVGQRLEEKNYGVHAAIGGLESGTVYRYQLVAATGSGERGGVKVGEVGSFAAAGVPVVSGVSVGGVSSTFAHFSAVIDPVGAATTYQVQYVTEAAFAQAGFGDLSSGGSVPVPAGDVGAGDTGVSVSVPVGGLSPGTSYRFRVVAENAVGVDVGGPGAEGMFVTLPAVVPGLPDGRAYELVTPVNKGDAKDMFGGVTFGGEISFESGYASEAGGGFLLWANAALGPFPASGESAYVFSRGDDGWSFKSVASPSLGVQAVEDLVFDPAALSMVGVTDDLGFTNERNAGLVGPAAGPYATVASTVGESNAIRLAGGSEDLGVVVGESQDRELPLCEASQEALAKTLDAGSEVSYEYSAARGCVALLEVQSRSVGGGLVSKCGARLGQGGEYNHGVSTRGAVSSDGSRVFFTAPDPDLSSNGSSATSGCWNKGSGANPPELYMRVNGETTVEISKRENSSVTPEYPAIFVGSAANGEKVFFLTRSELTPEAAKLGTHELELYEYDVEGAVGERLTRVSRGDLASGPVEGKVLDVPAVSADGSTVYFNAEGNLTPRATDGGLYRYDTEAGQTAFVAPPQSYPTKYSGRPHEGGMGAGATWYEQEMKNGLLPGLTVLAEYQTTRDGQFLLYGPWRYDAADGSTVCVMCNPGDPSPGPDAGFGRTDAHSDNPAGRAPRAMSETGEYVFFDTDEPLLAQATNGKFDVYEWHEDKASPSHQGTIGLISSGQSSTSDYFLDSSACTNTKGETVEGCNVFFGTHSQLVPADQDQEGDLYDARIEGGFPAPLGAAPCEGDACQPATPLPLFQTPATNTLASSGNLASEPPPPPKIVTKTVKCKQGFVRKKVKTKTECVKKPKKKSKAKKSAKSNRGGKS